MMTYYTLALLNFKLMILTSARLFKGGTISCFFLLQNNHGSDSYGLLDNNGDKVNGGGEISCRSKIIRINPNLCLGLSTYILFRERLPRKINCAKSSPSVQ